MEDHGSCVCNLGSCKKVWVQYLRNNHFNSFVISTSYFCFSYVFHFLTSETFLTQKVVFEADAIFYLPLVYEFVFLPISNTNYLPMQQALHIAIEVQLTSFINSICCCIEVCYDNEEQQQEGKTFACLS